MILYFADRKMNILGLASTELSGGLVVTQDSKVEDVETGVAAFSCRIPFTQDTREQAEQYSEIGNYILRSDGDENEFYTIIDTETDTENMDVYIYAEDAGLDLLNEVLLPYSAAEKYTLLAYIKKFTSDSGFEIGLNESGSETRQLAWSDEATATERLMDVAAQFGYEISFRFSIERMSVTHKYIDIYKKRGKDIGVRLRLNQDISRILTKRSAANIATALLCTGAAPDGSDIPVTLEGYKFDDGDFYTDGHYLKSRKALEKWSRYVWADEPGKLAGYEGHIVKTFNYDTVSQEELCRQAVSELKKVCDAEVNYEVDIAKLPENVRIGDRVNIIDDAGELYLSARILKLETSVADDTRTATLGEYLIQGSGISQKVEELAKQFSENALSAKRAQMLANTANEKAIQAGAAANDAATEADNALTEATEAQTVANRAVESANAAKLAANSAQSAVDTVEESITGMETSVTNAQAAADQAKQAAATADKKAVEAHTAAVTAQKKADEAAEAAVTAQSRADQAADDSAAAQSTADTAKAQAAAAQSTADAAKLDAGQAQKEIDSLSENLTTLSSTMTADYARKTDLTEAQASLQTQITQNAGQITSTAKKVEEVDETANHAAEQAAAAQTTAAAAQAQADTAISDAAAAQKAADGAKSAADTAQAEADKAKSAAETAQGVASKADADLMAAKKDLAAVQGRVDATEEDIALAQSAVTAAQAAADKAKADAAAAAQNAVSAQTTAEKAVTNAAAAQTKADGAAAQASAAQAAADAAKGDAAAAQTTADEAKMNAAAAQNTANKAKNNAAAAQTKADEAAKSAVTAQQAAADADAKAVLAQSDLNTAKQNLENVTNKVDATAEEVAAAQAAVTTAQTAADKAKADAAAAKSTASAAKADAQKAQTAADTAKAEADKAQTAAGEAQAAADQAQVAVDALAVRTTAAETKITQNAKEIGLRATKEEVTETLGGYYTKEDTDTALAVKAGEIFSSVSDTYSTKTELSAVSGKVTSLETWKSEASQKITKDGIIATVGSYYAKDSDLTAAGVRITDAESAIEQHAKDIALTVKEVDITGNYLISKINMNSTTVDIEAEHINLKGKTIADAFTCTNLTVSGNSVFEGMLNGATGSFSGNVTAMSGVIGGMTIENACLSAKSDPVTFEKYIIADSVNNTWLLDAYNNSGVASEIDYIDTLPYGIDFKLQPNLELNRNSKVMQMRVSYGGIITHEKDEEGSLNSVTLLPVRELVQFSVGMGGEVYCSELVTEKAIITSGQIGGFDIGDSCLTATGNDGFISMAGGSGDQNIEITAYGIELRNTYGVNVTIDSEKGVSTSGDLIAYTIKPSQICFYPDNTVYDEVQLRVSGDASAHDQALSFITVKGGSSSIFGKIFDQSEHFLPAFPVRIISIRAYSAIISSAVASGSTANVSVNITVDSDYEGGTKFAHAIPIKTGYGTVNDITISGSKATVKMLNQSPAAHTMSCTFLLIQGYKRW